MPKLPVQARTYQPELDKRLIDEGGPQNTNGNLSTMSDHAMPMSSLRSDPTKANTDCMRKGRLVDVRMDRRARSKVGEKLHTREVPASYGKRPGIVVSKERLPDDCELDLLAVAVARTGSIGR